MEQCVLNIHKPKTELFRRCNRRHVWQEPKSAFYQKNLIPTVAHGGGSVLLCSSGPGQLTITESTINSSLYQRVLENNVTPSVKRLKLSQKWTLQHDNDPKHSGKSTKEWLKRKRNGEFWKVQI